MSLPRLHGRGPRGTAGFSMVEVLVALLIMALMLTSITRMLTTVRTTRDHIHNTQETMLAGPAIMDMVERDLLAVFTLDRPKDLHLRVRNRVELGLDADRIDFVTTTDGKEWEMFEDRAARADLNEVGYVARPNPEYDEFLELYRREDFGVDDEPFSGGRYTFLHDRVMSFSIEVFSEDGVDAEVLEEWGVLAGDEETSGLPAWVRISMTLELAPRLLREQLVRTDPGDRVVTYTRIVRFPNVLRVALDDSPRLALPAQRPDTGAGGPTGPIDATGAGGGGFGGPLPGDGRGGGGGGRGGGTVTTGGGGPRGGGGKGGG